jgi:hypothetical protein
MEDRLTPNILGTIEKKLADLFFEKYQTSKALLFRWEEQWTHYKKLQEHKHKVSKSAIYRASLRMKASRKRFEVAYLDWKLHFQQLQTLLQAA